MYNFSNIDDRLALNIEKKITATVGVQYSLPLTKLSTPPCTTPSSLLPEIKIDVKVAKFSNNMISSTKFAPDITRNISSSDCFLSVARFYTFTYIWTASETLKTFDTVDLHFHLLR